MRRLTAGVLGLLALVAANRSDAIRLCWGNGATGITFSRDTATVLVVQADSGKALPSEWRLIWDADSSGLRVRAIDSAIALL
ncbi:MAG TPA: hypothetical protein VFK69_07070 [Candidatus Eisenbacteria bacterium]|nr:hypothetical protein [Candidatus Eisenbacteria bacterium]